MQIKLYVFDLPFDLVQCKMKFNSMMETPQLLFYFDTFDGNILSNVIDKHGVVTWSYLKVVTSQKVFYSFTISYLCFNFIKIDKLI